MFSLTILPLYFLPVEALSSLQPNYIPLYVLCQAFLYDYIKNIF